MVPSNYHVYVCKLPQLMLQSCLTSHVEVLGWPQCTMPLKLVQIFGLFVAPERVLVNGRPTQFSFRVLHGKEAELSFAENQHVSYY